MGHRCGGAVGFAGCDDLGVGDVMNRQLKQAALQVPGRLRGPAFGGITFRPARDVLREGLPDMPQIYKGTK